MQFEDQTVIAIRQAASTWRTLASRIRALMPRCGTGTPDEMAQAVDKLAATAMRGHLADRTARAAAAWQGWWDDLPLDELVDLAPHLVGRAEPETEWGPLG